MQVKAEAVVFTGADRVARQPLQVEHPVADQVLIQTYYSAISPGTEDMIFKGHFPENSIQDSVINSLSGDFSYPFQYGYALVGEIIAIGDLVAEKWLQQKVFVFHPHQSYALVSVEDCQPIPEHVSLLQALFLPNMESAVNFIMDAAPLIGEKVMVIGQGVVGLLTTALLSRFPLSLLMTSDPVALRRTRSLQAGAMQAINPDDKQQWRMLHHDLFDRSVDGMDLVFELSGRTEALNQAIAMTGFSGRIILGSWYTANDHNLNLGGRFHRSRIRLLSSQVSTLNPEFSGRWDKSRRMQLVWEYLNSIDAERFITGRFALSQCQQAYEANSDKQQSIQTIFCYRNEN